MASEPTPPPPAAAAAAAAEQEEEEAAANFKTLVLKVSIHCEGCKRKVSKILSKIEGVEAVHVDTRQNRVSFRSRVDAQTVIHKLKKHGKLAELLPEPSPSVPAPKPPAEAAKPPPPPEPAKISVERSSPPAEAVTVTTVDNSVIEAQAQAQEAVEAQTEKPEKTEKVDPVTGRKSSDTEIEKSKRVKDDQGFPPQPAYVMSYNTVEPSMSQSYFDPRMTTTQGHMYDDQYRYFPQHYDGPIGAYPNPTGYVHQSVNDPYNTMFSDENPDSSCTLM